VDSKCKECSRACVRTSERTKSTYLGLSFVEYEPEREEQEARADLQMQDKIVPRLCVYTVHRLS